jgi:hypothetical protein
VIDWVHMVVVAVVAVVVAGVAGDGREEREEQMDRADTEADCMELHDTPSDTRHRQCIGTARGSQCLHMVHTGLAVLQRNLEV